jgi:hypothetical protein
VCTDGMFRSVGSAVVVVIIFMQVLKCQYTGAHLIILAGVLLTRFCDICSTVACVVIKFDDSIVQCFVFPNFDNSSLPSISVYFPNVLRVEVLLFMLVLQQE